jgi:hypothetical protein
MQSLHQIQLAQPVEVGIGIVFSVGSERRIGHENTGRVGGPDFSEALVSAPAPSTVRILVILEYPSFTHPSVLQGVNRGKSD